MSARDHFVYRIRNAEGDLLYIGMTRKPQARWAQHRARSPWFSSASTVRMIGPLSREDASDLERLLILKAGPIHNGLRTLPLYPAWAKWRAEVQRICAEQVAAAS